MKMEKEYRVPVVTNPKPIKVSVPGSKSITNRALLIAALCQGKSTLTNVLFSDDSRYFLKALQDLGFPVEIQEESAEVTITGFGGQVPVQMEKKTTGSLHEPLASVYVGSAGTAARFLTAYLGLTGGYFRLDSSEQMKKRPMKELLVALEDLGAEILFEEEAYHFPFTIGRKDMTSCHAVVDVDKSSQFLSALLISSVLFTRDFTIEVVGNHGMAYVDMTCKMMEAFGVTVEQKDKTYKISGQAAYRALDYLVEPDLSAACYFYGMSPILGVPAQVNYVSRQSLQGDIAFLDVLKEMGCSLREDSEGITVLPPKESFKGGSFDLSAFSDQALTLAALAPFANEPVHILNVGHIRLQESDRIGAILTNLAALGVRAEEKDGNLTIWPEKLHGGQMQTYDDHRVAMAFSLPGLVTEGVIIENPSCCRKTFENYFEVMESIV